MVIKDERARHRAEGRTKIHAASAEDLGGFWPRRCSPSGARGLVKRNSPSASARRVAVPPCRKISLVPLTARLIPDHEVIEVSMPRSYQPYDRLILRDAAAGRTTWTVLDCERQGDA
jgi:hypothetical protein